MISNEFARIKNYYFSDKGSFESPPLLIWNIAIAFLLFIAAFLVSGFSRSLAKFLVLAAVSWFTFFILLHLVLWVLGSFYQHGLVKPFFVAGMFIVGLLSIAVILGVLLYGWIVPAFLMVNLFEMIPAPYSSWLAPLFVLFLVIFAISWYAMGMKIQEEKFDIM